MSWLNEVTRTVLSELGITQRREAQRRWRANAATAQPGETWTARYAMRDSRRRRHISWAAGPVELMDTRSGALKMLGEEQLPAQAGRLGLGVGVLPARYRAELERGDKRVPGPLPAAGGVDLEAVDTGVHVLVEHRDPAGYPGLRQVEDGYTGWIQTRDGRRGRTIGDAWVNFSQVTGLLRHDRDDALPTRPPGRRPGTQSSPITAESGLRADGAR